MLEYPLRQGYDSRGRLCGVVATWPGGLTHGVAIVLVMAIMIAVDNEDDRDEARIYILAHLLTAAELPTSYKLGRHWDVVTTRSDFKSETIF